MPMAKLRKFSTRPFSEGLPFIQALVQALPERTLWGTDWQHPNVSGDMPDEGELVDSFFAAVVDAEVRQLVLVENPKALYESTGLASER